MEKMANNGDLVSIHYTGQLNDGEVFDSTEDEEAHQFVAGAGAVIPGIDEAVVGMSVGQEKELTLDPDKAYGSYDDNLKQSFPRDMFSEDAMPQEGMLVAVNTTTGQQIPATINKVEEEQVELDFNHPLAGKTLTYKIKLVDVQENPGGECGCGPAGDSPLGGCSC